MTSDWQILKITHSELEHLTGLEISDTFMGRVYRPSVVRHAKRLLSFLGTEVLTFGLILIFCCAVGLVLARNLMGMTNSAASTVLFLHVAGGLSVAIALLWNLWMVLQSKRLATLAHLLDEVDKHNDIIDAIAILNELGTVKQTTVCLNDHPELFAALQATRESLMSALMTEKIIRKHSRFIARRYELFADVERNLATLEGLTVNHQAQEYGQLLNEALRIGISVHRELRNL